jgi:hypothetical protein
MTISTERLPKVESISHPGISLYIGINVVHIDLGEQKKRITLPISADHFLQLLVNPNPRGSMITDTTWVMIPGHNTSIVWLLRHGEETIIFNRAILCQKLFAVKQAYSEYLKRKMPEQGERHASK